MRRVLIAPDSFKGSLTAAEVASAIAEGWHAAAPRDELVLLPMADGGEGTLESVLFAVPHAQRMPVRVLGPAGKSIDTSWVLLPDGTAVVELAAASGILRLEHDEAGEPILRPFDAHTYGTGQAIRAAIEAGAHRVIVAIGGSCSTDGGAGLLAALGVCLLDAAGGEIPLGNRGLRDVRSTDATSLVALPPGGITVWSDVTVPLLGPHGAVPVFGPQKGIEPADFARAEAGLATLARVLDVDPATPGAGAAGGAGYGLLWLGAQIDSGADAITELIGLGARLESADAVIVGEGRYDDQSERGKIVDHVRRLADERGVPVLLVTGEIGTPADRFSAAVSLTTAAHDGESPMRDGYDILVRLGAELARRLDG